LASLLWSAGQGVLEHSSGLVEAALHPGDKPHAKQCIGITRRDLQHFVEVNPSLVQTAMEAEGQAKIVASIEEARL